MIGLKNWPRQMLSFNQKDKKWRKQHLDWADRKTYFYDSTVRKSLFKKRINYNLVNGYIDMNDITLILNPNSVNANFIPDNIQHYPIINSKLNVLRGEESKREFDFKVIVTNRDSINQIEKNKRDEIFQRVMELIQDPNLSEEDYEKELDKLNYFFTYEWKDLIEKRASYLASHYMKELSIPLKYNAGFMDALICGEEIYQCDIVGGEPTFERLNPLKTHIFKNGYSNKVEDADVIILIDFWSPNKIIDTFYDILTPEQVKIIDRLPQSEYTSTMGNIDERDSFVNFSDVTGSEYSDGAVIDNFVLFADSGLNATTNYIDNNGNIRVLRIYWKSKRKVKIVKYFDPETGEQLEDIFPENYQERKELGEEATVRWISESWEGTKIGKDIYVNMRPRIIQYNRISNPSRCHFGIVGSIYNLNDTKPYSMVDQMKPFAYLYDVIHDKLNKAIASNWGRILKLDLAMVPPEWDIEKWMYFAKVNRVAVVDSFNEGSKGASTGKLAGGLNNQTSGVIDAESGDYIQYHMNLLEWISFKMSESIGISKQREGQISNRETVGAVERSNLQSSHITEWYYMTHDDVKRRSIECFIETAKVAMKGKSLKFQNILPTGITEMVDIPGDEFADSDYGVLVDNSIGTQRLREKLDVLAQAALQNQSLSFSSILKVYTSPSLSEIMRIIEKDENNMMQRQSEQAQAQQELQKTAMEQSAAIEQTKLQLEELNNIRNNETKLLVEEMKAGAKYDEVQYDPQRAKELEENIRQFNLKYGLEKEALKQEKELKTKDLNIKKQIKSNKK